MDKKQDFEMNGISQIKIKRKVVLWTVFVTVVFCLIVGAMLWVTSTSRPATINTGGYTNGIDW